MRINIPCFQITRSLLLSLVCCFPLTLAAGITPESPLLKKQVTIHIVQKNLKETLDLVAAKAAVPIIYSNAKELFGTKMSFDAKKKPLKEIMDALLAPYPLTYQVIDEKIIISRADKKTVSSPAVEKQQINIRGKVSNNTGEPLSGASIQLKGSENATVADSKGEFLLRNVPVAAVLHVSYVGFKAQEVAVSDNGRYVAVVLEEDFAQLTEVTVSTGYQEIPPERATGSFVQIDNNLINRSVSTDIVSRLQGVTSGLNFDRRAGGKPALEIRSRGTILANDQPLIVLDNFPYDGDYNNINPNDIENITVLKDAAAASIWGVRAGNGVIVITTKKGRYNQPMKAEFNANLNLGQKPDLSRLAWISTADYIDLEKNLFARGYYDADRSNTTNPPAFTPVVELLSAVADGTLSQASANAQINALKQYDVWKDMKKYLYRMSADQQYALSLSGGSEKQKYYFSAGYDKNLDNIVNNGNDRLTLRAANTFRPIKNLELTTDLIYTQSQTKNNGLEYNSISTDYYGLYPYARLADDSGNPVTIAKGYSNSFKDTAQSKGLLNWNYVPLSEINNANNRSISTDFRLNTSARYNILTSLSAEIRYTYEKSQISGSNLYNQDTYYTRNLINQFTSINSDGSLTRNLPAGAIIDQNSNTINSNAVRGQLNFDQTWKDSRVTTIAGMEIRQVETTGNSNRNYGYDEENLSYNSQVNYANGFSAYDGNYRYITPGSSYARLFDGNVSFYGNSAYTYKNRYTISVSARLDQSNLFGVNANQKGVPLWSVGGSWDIDKEDFYKTDWLPHLKLRITYGYNGNLDKTLSALTTANYIGINEAGFNQTAILNPPNPELRWEKSGVLNAGIDFSTKNGVLSGTLEYYQKKGTDLLGYSPVDATTGVSGPNLKFEGNVANNTGNGMDIQLNIHVLDKTFKWVTNILYSHATDKVTEYSGYRTSGIVYVGLPNTRSILPIPGKPVYGVYSYKWAGLDPANGNPRGYLPDGSISEDYAALQNVTPTDLIYNGPARPTSFGSFRNTFTYKQISLSANIAYEFGFYYHRPTINYNSIFSDLAGSSEYARRWQNTGDESKTDVPSFIYPFNSGRDGFYQGASVNIEKGDNIRLQDISLSYNISKAEWHSLPLESLRLYLYANNIGMLWKASKSGIDPDAPVIPFPRTIAFGIKAGF